MPSALIRALKQAVDAYLFDNADASWETYRSHAEACAALVKKLEAHQPLSTPEEDTLLAVVCHHLSRPRHADGNTLEERKRR